MVCMLTGAPTSWIIVVNETTVEMVHWWSNFSQANKSQFQIPTRYSGSTPRLATVQSERARDLSYSNCHAGHQPHSHHPFVRLAICTPSTSPRKSTSSQAIRASPCRAPNYHQTEESSSIGTLLEFSTMCSGLQSKRLAFAYILPSTHTHSPSQCIRIYFTKRRKSS